MVLQGPLGFQPNITSMRPSSADRSRAVDVLAAAYAEGRLDGDEHRRRVEAALSATSYQQLGVLVSDVPVGPLPIPGQAVPVPAPAPMPPLGQSWPISQPYGFAPLPYNPPYPRYEPKPVDGFAVASLVLALISPFLFFLAGIPSVAALVTGHIAMSRADRHSPNSRGVAVAGTVIGYIGTALAVVILILEVTT